MIPNIVFPAPHGRFVLKKHNLQTKFPLDTLLLYRKTILVQNEPIMNEKELQTRKVIIETARNLFRQYGYEKTSIDQIAKAAHKAKGSVYYHFKGKEEVFKSALEEELDHLKHILIDVIQNPSFSIENRFEQYIIRRMEYLHDAYAYHITLMQDLSVNGSTLPSVMQLRKDFEQWEHDIMMRLTEEGIKTMQLQDIQPAPLSRQTRRPACQEPPPVSHCAETRRTEKPHLSELRSKVRESCPPASRPGQVRRTPYTTWPQARPGFPSSMHRAAWLPSTREPQTFWRQDAPPQSLCPHPEHQEKL